MTYSLAHLDDMAQAMVDRIKRHPVRDLEREDNFDPNELYLELASDACALRTIHYAAKRLPVSGD
jgi:hypothetical protein